MTKTSPALRLTHLINGRSANVGNGALTEGVEAVIGEDLGRPIAWSREPWDDYTFNIKAFDHDFVDLINTGGDALIVTGAVAINGREFYGNAGMRFDLPKELWPEIRKPVIFYGLSYRFWEGQTYHHADAFRWTMDHILSRDDMLFGVRNDGTREWLDATFGLASDRIHTVPDPGVFVPVDTRTPRHELAQNRINVVVALNDEDSERRYREPERRESILKSIASVVEQLITEHDANIILVPHYFDDYRMIADFVDLCRPALAHRYMIATGLARIEGSRDFYSLYQGADVVLSMRVHSMSPCIGLGVPMVPLVTQGRMTDFLTAAGLDDFAVDAFDPDLTAQLSTAVERTLSDSDAVRRRFAAARETMRDQLRQFNKRAGELLGR